MDIGFLFLALEIQDQVIYVSDTSKVYFISLMNTSSERILVTWTSLQRDLTSYTYIIINGLSSIQTAIVRSN